jgi:hypothetical protein
VERFNVLDELVAAFDESAVDPLEAGTLRLLVPDDSADKLLLELSGRQARTQLEEDRTEPKLLTGAAQLEEACPPLGHDEHGPALVHKIGDDIDCGLRLACAGRRFDDEGITRPRSVDRQLLVVVGIEDEELIGGLALVNGREP